MILKSTNGYSYLALRGTDLYWADFEKDYDNYIGKLEDIPDAVLMKKEIRFLRTGERFERFIVTVKRKDSKSKNPRIIFLVDEVTTLGEDKNRIYHVLVTEAQAGYRKIFRYRLKR